MGPDAILIYRRQREALHAPLQRQPDGHPALRTALPQPRQNLVIVVAVDDGAGRNPLRGGEEQRALAHAVNPRATKLAPAVEETDAITAIRGRVPLQEDASRGNARHLPERLPFHLRSIVRTDAFGTPVEEVGGAAPVECLAHVRLEARTRLPGRAPPQAHRRQHLIQPGAVVGDHVRDVGPILQPTLDLQRAHASLQQGAQVFAQVQIAEREEVLPADQHLPAGIYQGVWLAARLRALPAVAAAPAQGVAEVALAAVGDAERAVNETLQLDARLPADLADLVERQLPCRITR